MSFYEMKVSNLCINQKSNKYQIIKTSPVEVGHNNGDGKCDAEDAADGAQ